MNIQKKNNLKKNDEVVTQRKSQFKNKLITSLKNNKGATTLSILLLIVIIWFTVKLHNNENKFNKQKTQLINQYETTIDSLQIKHLKFASEIFSWTVRSELLRNNIENLNQLVTVFIKKSGADLVQIINSEKKIILLSSDKKFEGIRYTGTLNFELNGTTILEENGIIKIIIPIIDFNNTIGILIIEIKKKNNH